MTDFEERERWFEDRGYCVIEEEKIEQATREITWLRENNAELSMACQRAVKIWEAKPVRLVELTSVLMETIKKAVDNNEFYTK